MRFIFSFFLFALLVSVNLTMYPPLLLLFRDFFFFFCWFTTTSTTAPPTLIKCQVCGLCTQTADKLSKEMRKNSVLADACADLVTQQANIDIRDRWIVYLPTESHCSSRRIKCNEILFLWIVNFRDFISLHSLTRYKSFDWLQRTARNFQCQYCTNQSYQIARWQR